MMVQQHPSPLSSVLIFRLHSFHSDAVESATFRSDKLLGSLCGNILSLSNSLVNTKLSQLAEKLDAATKTRCPKLEFFFPL